MKHTTNNKTPHFCISCIGHLKHKHVPPTRLVMQEERIAAHKTKSSETTATHFWRDKPIFRTLKAQNLWQMLATLQPDVEIDVNFSFRTPFW